LDYMHARYFNPNAGRFLSADPHLGQRRFPESWNRYSYAANRPLTLIDSSGLDVIVAPALSRSYYGALWRSPELLFLWARLNHDHRVKNTIHIEPQAEPGTRAHSKLYYERDSN